MLLKLEQCFSDEKGAAEALTLLDSCGAELSERGRARIQLAILKLSKGDLEKLRHYVEVAELDYRDVLAWAEYPEQMDTGASRFNSQPEVIREIEERDRKQYLDWLQGDECK